MGFTTSKTSAIYITTHNHLCHESQIQAHTLCNSCIHIDLHIQKACHCPGYSVYKIKHVRSLKPWSAKYSQICQCQHEWIHVVSNNTSNRIQKSIIIIALVVCAHSRLRTRERAMNWASRWMTGAFKFAASNFGMCSWSTRSYRSAFNHKVYTYSNFLWLAARFVFHSFINSHFLCSGS